MVNCIGIRHAADTHRAAISIRDWADFDFLWRSKLKLNKENTNLSQKRNRFAIKSLQSNNHCKKVTMNIKSVSFRFLLLVAFFAQGSTATSSQGNTRRKLALPLIAGFEPSSDVTDLVCAHHPFRTNRISVHYWSSLTHLPFFCCTWLLSQ